MDDSWKEFITGLTLGAVTTAEALALCSSRGISIGAAAPSQPRITCVRREEAALPHDPREPNVPRAWETHPPIVASGQQYVSDQQYVGGQQLT